MAAEKVPGGSKKMTFSENSGPEREGTTPVPSGKIKRINVNFDEEKHTRFKAACVRNGASITTVLNHLVDTWLKDNE